MNTPANVTSLESDYAAITAQIGEFRSKREVCDKEMRASQQAFAAACADLARAEDQLFNISEKLIEARAEVVIQTDETQGTSCDA